jgi:hypothetical protein
MDARSQKSKAFNWSFAPSQMMDCSITKVERLQLVIWRASMIVRRLFHVFLITMWSQFARAVISALKRPHAGWDDRTHPLSPCLGPGRSEGPAITPAEGRSTRIPDMARRYRTTTPAEEAILEPACRHSFSFPSWQFKNDCLAEGAL